jgi:hypothetical protein
MENLKMKNKTTIILISLLGVFSIGSFIYHIVIADKIIGVK